MRASPQERSRCWGQISDSILFRGPTRLVPWVWHYMLKRYDEAVRWYASRLPNFQAAHLSLAAAYAQLRRLEEAKAEAAQVLRINPGFTIERHKRVWVHKDPKDLEHCLDGLRKAGLPEA